jgi:hypothetical protein
MTCNCRSKDTEIVTERHWQRVEWGRSGNLLERPFMLKTPIARTQRSRTRKVIKTTRKNKDPKGFDDCMSSSSSVVGGGVVDKERNRSGERRNKGRKIVEYESLAKHYNEKRERERNASSSIHTGVHCVAILTIYIHSISPSLLPFLK